MLWSSCLFVDEVLEVEKHGCQFLAVGRGDLLI